MCINTNSFGCSGRCFLNFHVYIKHMVCVLVIQSCPALWEPMDGSLPGFSVHGILQARIVESVGCHALLQGIFPTQVFRIVGRFFTDWTTREAKHMEVVSALWAQAVIWQVGFCLGTESLRFYHHPGDADAAVSCAQRSVVSGSVIPSQRVMGGWGLHARGLLYSEGFLGKNPGVGCHFLFQEIFPTRGLNLWPVSISTDVLSLTARKTRETLPNSVHLFLNFSVIFTHLWMKSNIEQSNWFFI